MRDKKKKNNNNNIHQTDDTSDLDISTLISGVLITILDSCSISINDELFN